MIAARAPNQALHLTGAALLDFARHQAVAAAPARELARSALSSGPNPMPEPSAVL